MENKKDIGKLFKDNLSQLDYSPSEMVWDKIETDLKKDKKKRRFFFWFFLSSILIIGTTCYSYYYLNSIQEQKNIEKSHTNTTRNQNQENSYRLIDSNSNVNSNNNKEINNKLHNTNPNTISNEIERKKSNNTKTSNKNLNPFNQKAVSNKNQNKIANKKTKRNSNNSIESNNKNFIENSKGRKTNYFNSKTKSLAKNSKISIVTASFKNTNNTNFSKKQQQNIYANETNHLKNKKKKNKNKKDNKIGNTIPVINSASKESTSAALNKENFENSKAINLTEIDSCNLDENCIIPVEKTQKKPEKKKLPETKKDSVIKPKSKTFIISPFAGFNNNFKIGTENKYGNEEVVDQPKKYGNLFGLKLKWMFSERTGIQSGVSINTLYYNTTVKKQNGNLETESIELNQEPSAINTPFNADEKVTFQQHLRYIEIPFEAYHYFNTKKLSHATSFGLSFYFPLKNQVNAYSDKITKMNIGKSQAYLKQGYGLNLNYYLNYNLSNKIQIFITPAAQFQFLGNLDYVQSTSYTFSISTGINYKL